MDDSLNRFPLSFDVQRLIQFELWKECRPDAQSLLLSVNHLNRAYFEYYTTRCQRFLRDGSIHVLLKRHSEIFDIAKLILLHSTYDEIESHMMVRYLPGNKSPNANLEAICTTINLCASLLLMAHVGTHKYGISGWNPLPWSQHQTLRQAVQHHFQEQKRLIPDNQRLGSIFTARNIQYISGIKMKWTENIVDHLLLTDDDQTVFIFPCVGFLRFQQRYIIDLQVHLSLSIGHLLRIIHSFAEPIYPDGFVEETIRTLTLLFPANDTKSRLWLKSILSSNDRVDKDLSSCGSLRSHERRFENFSYWHDRLVILKQAFDDSSPRTLNQWWNDRRNSVQWYTFWVAILVFIMTVVFGVIQSVEGGLQVYFSWKALHP